MKKQEKDMENNKVGKDVDHKKFLKETMLLDALQDGEN